MQVQASQASIMFARSPRKQLIPLRRVPTEGSAFTGGGCRFADSGAGNEGQDRPAGPAAREDKRVKISGARIWISLGIVAVLVAGAVMALRNYSSPRLHGAPVPVAPLVRQQTDPTQEYPESFPLQVAVLLTKPHPPCLGLIHAFREMGIPFFFTYDFDRALQHHMLVLYPTVVSNMLSAEQVKRLTEYVQNGGQIYAQNVLWGGLKPLFGFRSYQPSRERHQVTFITPADPIFRYLDQPEEMEVSLGSEKIPEIFWTNGYQSDGASQVLALFKDGSAALLGKSLGKGKTYLCALRFEDVTARSQADRDYDAERHGANAFEPGADVWMLILRAWYEAAAPGAVRLATLPDGHRSALLLTHDLDRPDAFQNAEPFVQMEQRRHLRSTLFVKTQYLQHPGGPAFFRGNPLKILRRMKAQGFDIESGGVTRAGNFHRFPLGTGDETLSTYRPRVSSGEVSGGTVFGEVRMSKSLLDGELPGQRTTCFRALSSRQPDGLPEALERTGYQFDSSFTADDVLSNFPYRLSLGLGMTEDTSVYEFPVTIEDQEPPAFAGRIAAALKVIDDNAANGAVSVLLIHPDDPTAKVPAEESLLEQLPQGVMVSDLLDFARFWRARDQLQWSVQPTSDPLQVILRVAARLPASGLTFEFSRAVASVEGSAYRRLGPHQLILAGLEANQKAEFRVHYAPLAGEESSR
jgi:hypothetical protein